MNKDSFIEVIYIGTNNKIIGTNFKYTKGQTLDDLLDYLIKKSIFSHDFLSKKHFSCFGEIINMNYLIKENDRIEILDNLKISPNDKRKHNFYKNQ
tara:strand:+ start:1101 stop:1388 length:288 start_codon:yes stop_codon:yes gene_type:complete